MASISTGGRSWYQSWWGDQAWQARHCVSRQTLPQRGQRPCVSNVFQACPQVQDHRASGGGSHLHFGQ